MNETVDTLGNFESILLNYRVLETIQEVRLRGWQHVWEAYQKIYDTSQFKDDEEKYIFVDLFFSQCLQLLPTNNIPVLMQLIEKWLFSRKLEGRCGWLKTDEKIALVHFCVKFRDKLCQILIEVPPEALNNLSDVEHRLLITVWRQVFFEPFSALALFWNPPQLEQESLLAKFKSCGYGGLMAASMYQPFGAADYQINAEELLAANIPYSIKTIIIFWMVTTPYFHGTDEHRQKLMKYVPELCSALIRHPQIISTYFFFGFVQEVMTGFWRASYIGGNNVDGLSAFGDFISLVMQQSFPAPQPVAISGKLDRGEKIRIGYISRNFFKQAVSCYMVNRVVYHDRNKFEVHIFALGDYHDAVSDMFKQNSASFQRFTDLANLHGIADAIREKELDILIYTDIGMDPVTYMLSGLQLAPVQCALVGHGTTTGMPSIQYYLSGDFEGPVAQTHYREKLIRLPMLGAAQYLPMKPEKHLSREDLGIPDDGVIFISCANGLKHGIMRNPLLVEILQKAPNAYILLKPYAHYGSIDHKFAEEIVEAANNAGVGDRLKILPPIADPKHVLGLLAIADVQLDTYPYGGWTTNMEALYMGLPIVTQQGELARSRWGAGMLKALGIHDGIAASEAEYVAEAVKFTKDSSLLEKLKHRIKKRVKKMLFNGKVAQASYEEALIGIYLESCCQEAPQTKLLAAPPVIMKSTPPVIVTSVTPGDYARQRRSIRSWQDIGFKVVSMNAIDEIANLQEYFDVDFVAAPRDARQEYGRPYVYFDDVLTYFRNRDIKICGIVTPDIQFTHSSFLGTVEREAQAAFVYGSRLDDYSGDTNSVGNGTDFDFFFFDRRILQCYPKQVFCLGLPWWDYWAILIPLMYQIPVKRITAPIAATLQHKPNWDRRSWLSLGAALASNFKPPYPLSANTMPQFANDTLAILKTLSAELAAKDGRDQYGRPDLR